MENKISKIIEEIRKEIGRDVLFQFRDGFQYMKEENKISVLNYILSCLKRNYILDGIIVKVSKEDIRTYNFRVEEDIIIYQVKEN